MKGNYKFMKKNCKKLLSIMLSAILVLTLIPFSVFAYDNKCDCEYVPMIYVYGRQTTYDDPSSPDRRDLQEITDEQLSEFVKGALPSLSKALVTNNYDEYCDYLINGFIGLLGEFSCDKEGNIKDGSGIDYGWSADNPDTLGDWHKGDNVYQYVFCYDARLDPFEVADDLKVFIDTVKKVTGHDTINVISRCMGSEYALAYFVKYGWDDVETFVQNCSSANGTTIMSEIFAGKIELDDDAIDRFIAEDNVEYEETTRVTVALLNQMKALGLATETVNKIIDKIKAKVVPGALLGTYGTCPGYWSMVSKEDYRDAMNLIFSGREEEYSVLIEKLENYDKLVRSRTSEILTQMHNDGVKLCNIVKYGYQLQPFTASHDTQSDDKISVYHQSYGATGSDYGKTFSKLYLYKAKRNGTAKYISPDNTIDASTCLFPETTWFMKDIRHNNFPGCVNQLYIAACRSEKELTINDDARFPQYLRHYYWEDSLVPLTEENAQLHSYTNNFFTALKNFLKVIIPLIKEKLNSIIQK